MSALRHELSRLPLQSLHDELTRIGRHCRDSLPSFPSLYPASPPLSALLRWLQTVCWAVSSERRCQTLRVDNFTSALSDGLAMAALLDWYGLAQQPFSQLQWHKQAKLYKAVEAQVLSSTSTPAAFTAADGATAAESAEGETDQSGKAWSCSFSFAELTRADPSDEQAAAQHNWTLFLSSLHTLSPSLFLCCPLSADFFYAGNGRCDERVVVVFLCRLAGELLARSEQLHAVRRVQRWWRRCVERRNMQQALQQLLVSAAEERQADSEQSGEAEIEADHEEGEAAVDQLDTTVEEAELDTTVEEAVSEQGVERIEVLPADLHDSRAWAETSEVIDDFVFSPALHRRQRTTRDEAELQAEWADSASAIQQARRQAELEQRLREEQAALAAEKRRAAEQRAAHELQLARQQAKQKYERTVDAVTVLQAAWRGKQARQQLARLRELRWRTDELERQRREEAAVCVQRVWRGYRLRKDVRLILSIKAEVEVELAQQVDRLHRERAATSIQAVARGWLARRAVQRLRMQRQVEARRCAEQAESERRRRCRFQAGLVLRPFLQRHAARVQAEEQLERDRRLSELQDASARVIQQAWRRWRRRQAGVAELRERIHAARVESVVIGLQARVRGKLARRRVQQIKEERAAESAREQQQLLREERRREERDRLLHRVRHLNAVVIQRQVRVYLARQQLTQLRAVQRAQQRQRAVEEERCAVVIQSAWRGYRQRRATPGLASRRAELALAQSNAAVSPELRVAERCAAAMSALLNARSLAAATRACTGLVHLSMLLPPLCDDIARHASTLPALLSLVRSAGRTSPHTELVLAALALLCQLAGRPSARQRLYCAQPLLLPALTEQLQLSRDHTRLTRRVVRLLRSGERFQAWRVAVRASEGGGVRRRLDGVCELLERKCRMERRCVLGLFAQAGGDTGEQARARHEREVVAANLRRFLQVIDQDVE